MVATYSGNLVAFLTVTTVSMPFDTLEEMVHQSAYSWGCEKRGNLYGMFRVSFGDVIENRGREKRGCGLGWGGRGGEGEKGGKYGKGKLNQNMQSSKKRKLSSLQTKLFCILGEVGGRGKGTVWVRRGRKDGKGE